MSVSSTDRRWAGSVEKDIRYGDLTDFSNLIRLMRETPPDGIFNSAALAKPASTKPLRPGSRASCRGCPKGEETPFCPRSPYAVAKLCEY